MIAAVLMLIVVTSSVHAVPDIAFKYSKVYDLIWNDRGSGGDNDGSVWRVRNYQSEFCSIGDVSVRGYGAPLSNAVLIKAIKSGATARPKGFTQIWNDKGSGADRDVAIYSMNAPNGYTCLGDAATNNKHTTPDASKYCCVKNEYVVRGDTLWTYNDRGSGSDRDVSLWQVVRGGSESYGILGGNFKTVAGYNRQPALAYLLRESNKVQDVWSLPSGEVKPLNLYEMNEMKWIWNDRGTGADRDCSIWRPEIKPGYFPVGDVVVGTHAKPTIGFLVRPTAINDDSVKPPVSYSRIWNDAGSGGSHDLQLWKVNCPGGYVALGNVGTNGPTPNIGDIYCVKRKYTTYGNSRNWQRVWTDAGSGANRDVAIYEAVSTQSNQQTARGFGAIANHHSLPGPPFLLNKDYVTYKAEKPILKIYISNVKYDLNAERSQTAPVKMSPTILINHSNTPQTVRRTLTYTVTESHTFTYSQAIEIGMSVELSAGIPLIGISSKTTLSVKSTSTFTAGSTTQKSHQDSLQAVIEVPAHSKITAVIEGTQFKADIPYTANIKKMYYDGSIGLGQISGVYKGVNLAQFKVTYGQSENI